MMYPRLKLLHRLLTSDGVFLVSIDDIELSNIKLVLDEIFGLGSFISQNIVARSNNGNGGDLGYSGCHDYVLVYKKALIAHLYSMEYLQVKSIKINSNILTNMGLIKQMEFLEKRRRL